MMNWKKGVSPVIATVLLIVITVSAVGILIGILKPNLMKKLDSADCSKIDFSIDDFSEMTCFSPSSSGRTGGSNFPLIAVEVQRGGDSFEISGIQFVFEFEDGEQESFMKEQIVGYNEKKLYFFGLETNVAAKKVSIAPILNVNGKEVKCPVREAVNLKECKTPLVPDETLASFTGVFYNLFTGFLAKISGNAITNVNLVEASEGKSCTSNDDCSIIEGYGVNCTGGYCRYFQGSSGLQQESSGGGCMSDADCKTCTEKYYENFTSFANISTIDAKWRDGNWNSYSFLNSPASFTIYYSKDKSKTIKEAYWKLKPGMFSKGNDGLIPGTPKEAKISLPADCLSSSEQSFIFQIAYATNPAKKITYSCLAKNLNGLSWLKLKTSSYSKLYEEGLIVNECSGNIKCIKGKCGG